MELLKQFSSIVADAVEAAAALIIMAAAAEAFVGVVRCFVRRRSGASIRKDIWLRFGVWLLLALEFELAADVVRTAVTPTWTDLGQLASIAVIRTFLGFFLEKDLEKYDREEGGDETGEEAKAAATHA